MATVPSDRAPRARWAPDRVGRLGTGTTLLILAGIAAIVFVAPGIAEALFATALGLVAAIPAVIFYNKLSADADRIVAIRADSALQQCFDCLDVALHRCHG